MTGKVILIFKVFYKICIFHTSVCECSLARKENEVNNYLTEGKRKIGLHECPPDDVKKIIIS